MSLPFAAGKFGSVSVARVKSMGLLVAEKTFNDATSHKLEATIGLMASGSPHFPVFFGQTDTSLIIEFIGDPASQRPGSTIHAC